ncbi:MAG: PAS domain S-box protein, partial [Bacteroidota bacterium]|nr:PAS domain S-box protein [Bacteroidota bacterium]
EIFPKLVSLTNGSYFGQDVVITFAIDITDRKLAEDAVRKSEEKYRLIVNNTKDVIWKIDLNKNFTYISPAVEKLTGYTQEEYLKFSLNECMADKDLENMDRVLSGEMNKIMQGKFDELLDSYVIDVTVFHKEGRNIICEMKAFLVFDKNQVVGIQGIISDITKRKEDEKKLRESENRFVSFMNYLPSLVFIKHEKGEYVYTNKYYNDFFGDNVDVIGKSSSDIFSDDISENIKTNDIEVLNKGIRILDQEINGNDNKQHIFKTYKFPILLEDKTKLIGGFAIDITKEKKAELIQQVVYNISNAVNIEYNEKDFFSIIQQELSKLIDTKNFYIAVYNIEKDIIELPYMDDERMNYSIAPNDSATAYVIRTKKALLAKQKDIERFEQQGKFKMRGLISKIWLGVPLKSDKKVIGMIGVQSYSNENQYNNKDKKILEIVATQIGFFIERKRANQELVKAKEKAEESDKLKSVFLANMSHEIRTPMNGMIGFAEMLKLKGLSEEKRDNFIDIINQSGHQLLTIINDIIDVSKIEANQIKLNKKNIPVNKLIEEVNSLFLKNKELKAKGLKLLCKLPDNECNIYTDEVRLKQILSNLVSNAIKFTPKGVIEFGYEITNSMLKFFVKDTGIGIHEKDKKIIFKRFRQIDEGSTRKYGGTGIGLAICKELVEMLDGEIWLESNSQNGSIFYFTIPNISGELKKDSTVRKVSSKTVV